MAGTAEFVRAIRALEPERPHIEFDGHLYTRGDVDRAATEVETCLDTLAVPPDARVGVLLRNRPGHIAVVAAVIGSNRCLVTLNPVLPADKLLPEIARLRLPVIIAEHNDGADDAFVAAVTNAGSALVLVGGLLEGAEIARPMSRAIAPADITPGVAVEMLTSGTTGTPKRVPLSRAALDASFAGTAQYEKGGKGRDAATPIRSGVNILGNPLTHIGGLYGCIGALASGRLIVLQEKFSVAGWVDAVRRHRPKAAGAVPTAIRMLLDADVDPADLTSLSAVACGTAPLAPELVDAFYEKFGVPVLCNYGATEFAGGVAGWSIGDFREHWRAKYGSVGRIHGNVDARIVDADSGGALGVGEEGLLELRGAQLGERHRRGDGEWLRTTDRAVIDADGFLFIRGRADNAIIRGGFKVHPDDVVAALHRHPAVREAAVVGIPDARLGAVPAAAVILKHDAEQPDVAALQAWLRDHLTPYQVPAQIRFVADFPRTPSLKPSLAGVISLFEAAP